MISPLVCRALEGCCSRGWGKKRSALSSLAVAAPPNRCLPLCGHLPAPSRLACEAWLSLLPHTGSQPGITQRCTSSMRNIEEHESVMACTTHAQHVFGIGSSQEKANLVVYNPLGYPGNRATSQRKKDVKLVRFYSFLPRARSVASFFHIYRKENAK